MTAKQLFSKTMPFIMAKLAVGGIMVIVAAILLAILMGLGWLFGDAAMLVTFCIWLAAMGVVRFVIMHYFGYLVKAGHIAVIAEAFYTGQVPANQVNYGKEMVKQRFATANVYFAVDKLVTGAVKEIQRGIGKLGNKLDFIPGMEAVTGAAQFFINISLGYIDECCFGWTFYNKNQGPVKSAADGVVIYAQNWKILLKNAAMTMIKVILGTVIIALVIFVPIGILFKILKWSGLFAFVLACIVAWVVKFAVMDSYIMIQMMTSYMTVAPTTVLSYDLYSKLSGLSGDFAELYKQGKEEPQPTAQAAPPVQPAATPAPAAPVQTAVATPIETAPTEPVITPQPETPAPQADEAKPKFCGQCGAPNETCAGFCGSCGAKL